MPVTMTRKVRPGKAVVPARLVSALVCAALTSALVPGRALAQQAGDDTAPPPSPITIQASLISDTQSAVSGDRRGTRSQALADLRAIADGAGFGAPGFSAMLDLAAYSGNGFTTRVLGDAQGVSSIEAGAALHILNAWVGWTGRHTSVKAGIIDTNADFDEMNVAAPFLNASHGMGPEFATAGPNGPGANPFSGLGAVAALFDDASGLRAKVGLLSGRSGNLARPSRPSFGFGRTDGTVALAEVDWTGPSARIALGGWRFSSLLPRADGTGNGRGSHGGFVIVEGRLAGPADGRRLEGWVRLGAADARHALVTRSFGGGLVANGLKLLSGEDTVGVAVASARPNRATGPGTRTETTLEATFQTHLHSALVVQPDVQYVIHPGGVNGRSAALVAGLRLILAADLIR